MLGCTGKNKAKTAISVAVEAKPEVEIWRRPKKINFLTLVSYSFRQFLAKMFCFATIQNVTDRRQTDDRQTDDSVPKVQPIVRSANKTMNIHTQIQTHIISILTALSR